MSDEAVRIRDSIRQFILDTIVYGADDDQLLGDEILLIDNGILDSFGIHEVLYFLEEEFGIEIKDAEVIPRNLGSIGAMALFVQTKQAELRK
jgi:acyl carrier protein